MSRYLVRCIQEILLLLLNLISACPESHGSSGAAKASSTAALIRNGCERERPGVVVSVRRHAHEHLDEPLSVSPGTDPDRGRGVPRPDLRPSRRLLIVSAHGGRHDVVRRWTCGSSPPEHAQPHWSMGLITTDSSHWDVNKTPRLLPTIGYTAHQLCHRLY